MPDFALLDPNLIYLALVAGLWIGVTAVYIPGTGIPEITSLVLLVGSLVILGSLATAWWAVAALFLGVSMFLLLPFFGEKYGRFAEVGLIGQVIGGWFLFQDQSISPIVIAVTVILSLLYNRFVIIPTMRNQRHYNEYDESNAVIGIRGRVVKDLDPVGTIYVNKELWRARSSEDLSRDTSVMVVGQDGLELIVEKSKNEDVPSYHDAQKQASLKQ
ncbi:MAG: NfeD family protein [Phototrophicaceae bacterium]